MANAPFWQLALLQTIGPAITVLFGTWAIARITAHAQRRREEQQLRHDLIVEMSETASSLYLATQRFRRAQDESSEKDQLQTLRGWLAEQYHEKRAHGDAVEQRIRVNFPPDGPERHWHATMDLLTILYFQLMGYSSPGTYARNAGREHSGLTVSEMEDLQTVRDHYRQRLAGASFFAISSSY